LKYQVKKEAIKVSDEKGREKTVYKALGLGGLHGGGGACAVDVKDDKIVRIRPLRYDLRYTREQINPWKVQRNGKTLDAPMKSMPAPFSLAYKKRAYSPNRVKYPLKRVDWDPNGERNTQNRGKSKYQRISWDEAAGLVASELKRVHKEYGPYAVLGQTDGHGENKLVHTPHGQQARLHDKIGGFTHQIRNPDSWEGWYWGSMHVWGTGSVGMMSPSNNLLKDISENSEMVLFWGCDPGTTPMGICGQLPSRICYFWREAGIKEVYVCPDLNYGAAVHADKWIPVLPNTDAAMQLAIIYIWITEGIYDKDYVATHVIGMDKVEDYVLGREDGVPKTPEWASPKCGVSEWTIKALAREFAAKTTTIAHGLGGSYIRGPYSHEPARLECILLGMQGLGKPGVHQYVTNLGGPRAAAAAKGRLFAITSYDTDTDAVERVMRPIFATFSPQSKQGIPKTLLQEAILNPPITYWGDGAITSQVEDQFVEYTYPIPKEEGGTEIHMIWTDTPCRTTCWNDGNKTIEAMRSPKIECIVAQHPWLENDCLLADIILPANTTFEVDDIVTNFLRGIELQSVTLQRQAIPPIGESKSDYEIVLEIARKMGVYDEVTEGWTVEDAIKGVFEAVVPPEAISWDEFNEKGYYVFQVAEDWEKDTVGLRDFYDDPEANPLPMPSGKLEFYSERLAKNFPGDVERPPIPKWIEKSETHDERLSSERARKYPLLQMSNHGRWRTHSQADDVSWSREAPTCKVKGPDGYMYEPLWLNPQTAAERDIKSGDIVMAYNERGAVLCGAYVTERIMPGVSYVDHGSRCDWIIPGKLDRGGAINLISNTQVASKHAAGQATSGYLVEVERVTLAQMEEWKEQYPDAFEREYEPAYGLRFNAWVEGGMY
jgi:molybdopterin guanine dinucleotide-containing S/N-oxide reductase-like protein